MITDEKKTDLRVDTKLHFETSYIKIIYNADRKYVEVFWKAFAPEEQVREALLKEIEIVSASKSKGILIDAREFKGTTPKMQKWINDQWSKMAAEGGLKYVSVVVAGDIFQLVTLNNALGSNFAAFVTFEKFMSLQQAQEWLLEKHK